MQLRRITEPAQASNGWSKEILSASLIHPGTSFKVKFVGLLRIHAVIQTDMTFRMILSLSLVDEWIHSRAVLVSSLLGRGENAVACPAFITVSNIQKIMTGRGLTGHEKIKSISDVTLVAGKVNTTAFGGLLRLIGSKLRSKRDTTAQNNGSVFLIRFLIRFLVTVNLHIRGVARIVNQRIGEFSFDKIVVLAKVALVVGSGAHFTGVRGKRATQNALLGPKIEVVSECKALVVLVGS
jgi:hypothetical protein